MTTHEAAEALVERWIDGVSVPEAVRLIEAALDAAKMDGALAEREACAREAESFTDGDDGATVVLLIEAIARNIRARGEGGR